MLNVLSLFQKPACGIDISDYSIEFLCMGRRGESANITSYGRRVLEKGIVEDGRILDKGKLANELRKVVEDARPRPVQTVRVVASLPESKTFIHVFSIPADVSGEELRQAANSEAKKVLPFEEKEMYADVVVGETVENNSRQVLYAACPKQVADDFLETFGRAGLHLSVLDLESASIARAVVRSRPPTGPLCIVDMGARTINVTIYEKKLIQFSGMIFLGGIALTDKISRSLSVLPEKAELLKREVGFDSEREEGKVMFALQEEFQRFVAELDKIVRFFQEKTGKKIEGGVLVGGTSLIPGLAEYLNFNTKIRFELANPLEHIDARLLIDAGDPSAPPEEIPRGVILANIIGLALRGAGENVEREGVNFLRRKSEHWLEKLIHT